MTELPNFPILANLLPIWARFMSDLTKEGAPIYRRQQFNPYIETEVIASFSCLRLFSFSSFVAPVRGRYRCPMLRNQKFRPCL